MKEQLKKILPYGVVLAICLALLGVFAHFTQSSLKTQKEEINDLKVRIIQEEKFSSSLITNQLNLLAKVQKLETKLKQKSKAIDVEITKNADGSSKKTVKVRENEKEETSNQTKTEIDAKVTKVEDTKTTEIKKDVAVDETKVKKEKTEKKSNWVFAAFSILTTVVIFVTTGIIKPF